MAVQTGWRRRGAVRTLLALTLLALGLTLAVGCNRGQALQPGNLPPKHGAAFGRVSVFKGDTAVTGSCNVAFSDESQQHHTEVSVDDAGWVFASLPQGTNWLSFVNCVVWNGLSYRTRALRFDVVGGGRATYFGDVRFDLPDQDGEVWADAIGSVGGRIAGTSTVGTVVGASMILISEGVASELAQQPAQLEFATVEALADPAIAEYERRYGSTPDVAFSLAGESPEGPIRLYERGALLTAGAPFDGMRLIFMGEARTPEPRLRLRVQREGAVERLRPCRQLRATIDGTSKDYPVTYQRQSGPQGLREGIEAEVDLLMLQAVAAAKSVRFEFCTFQRTLTPRGAAVAAQFIAAYQSRLPAPDVAAP